MDDKEIDDEFENINYKPPPEKSLAEILEADKGDDSLRRYKEDLLGAASIQPAIVEPNNPNRVVVKSLSLLVKDRPEMVLDLSGDLRQLEKQCFKIKEGIQYVIRINFFVQREIVFGLRYIQKIYRTGLQVEKMSHMVGSYAPKDQIQSYFTPTEEMPHGIISRGKYTVKSLFTDDDKNEYLKWEWQFELSKDWE